MIFDTHAHYDDRRFDEDRDSLLTQILEQGIKLIVNVGADLKGSEKSVELADKYPFVYASVGVHPHEAKHLTDRCLARLEQLAKNPKVIAFGEIGLDYYYNHSDRETQRAAFVKQLELANSLGLPKIIHSRDACAETLELLQQHSKPHSGVIHCFSGSYETAKQYVGMGYFIGIGGVVTYKNAVNLVKVCEGIALEHIVLETDCPYLAPVPHRGQRNDSSNLGFVAERIAQIKGIDADEVCRVTYENGLRLYGLANKEDICRTQ